MSAAFSKARALALDCLDRLDSLNKLEGGNAPFLPELLRDAAPGLDDRARAQATALVYGFLRRDSAPLLTPYLSRPGKLSRKFRLCLRLAAWELVYGHEPEHAILHQWGQAARAGFGARMAGLLNAVLRSMQKDLPRLRNMPLTPQLALAQLPPWIAQLWSEAYGPDQAGEYALRACEEPSACYRVNRSRLGWQELRQKFCGIPFGACGLADAPQSPELQDAEARGLISRQGASSQLLAETLLSLGFQGPVWDACCGRGGKSLALLEAGCPVRWASDPHEGRLRQFGRDLARLELPSPELLPSTAEEAALSNIPCILLDAPCSGLGTLARTPELKLRLTSDMTAQSAALQGRLLDALWPKLAPGGLLAYATCSMNPAENEGRISSFLAAAPDASLLQQTLLRPASPLSGQDHLFLALLRKAD